MEKKFQRDMQNKVIGGVCSGLANYFSVDVAIVRVIFALALLCFSTGFWLYLILWIVMPASTMGSTQEYVEVNDEGQPIQEKPRNNSMTAGLVLIVAGGCFLLANLVPQFNWRMLWPIALIALGVYLIIPTKDKKS